MASIVLGLDMLPLLRVERRFSSHGVDNRSTPHGENGRDELRRRRRSRNIALAILLFALVVLFYLVTIIRISEQSH